MQSIDTIKVECDERGFELHFTTDEGDEFAFNMQAVAPEFWDEMVKTVGDWVLEMHAAKREFEMRRDAETGPWPGESAMDYYRRTADAEPLLEMADDIRDRAKVGD